MVPNTRAHGIEAAGEDARAVAASLPHEAGMLGLLTQLVLFCHRQQFVEVHRTSFAECLRLYDERDAAETTPSRRLANRRSQGAIDKVDRVVEELVLTRQRAECLHRLQRLEDQERRFASKSDAARWHLWVR
jgi:hypothetical protein